MPDRVQVPSDSEEMSIREIGRNADARRLNELGEWDQRMFCCDLCGREVKGDSRVLMHALLTALVLPEEDERLDRRIHDWPSIPLRRKRICADCYDPHRHVRFLGLEGADFQIALVLPEGARRGYCKVCMGIGRSIQTLWDGVHCSQRCAGAS